MSLPSSPRAASPRAVASSRGFLFVALAALCWGTAGISGRVIASHSDLTAIDIAWYRLTIGAVVLLVGWASTRHRRVTASVPMTRPVVVRLVLIAGGLAAYQFLFFTAVARAGVSISTLVALGLAPLLIAVGALLLGHGRPDGTTVAALVVALVGLVLLVGISAGESVGTAVLLGALLAAGSGLGYAVVTLASGGVPTGVPVTLVGFTGGAVLLTPVVLAGGPHFPTDPLPLGVLLYLGLVPSALAYALFFTGVRTLPGPVASIVTLLEPLTATVLATAFLGERLSTPALAGGLLVLCAVATLYLRRMGDSNSRGVAPNPLSKRAP